MVASLYSCRTVTEMIHESYCADMKSYIISMTIADRFRVLNLSF